MASGRTPGNIALVTPDGAVREVADGLAFPNGMVVTPDNGTLIVAESFARRLTAFDIAEDGSLSNRRTWADVTGDGICLDAEGAIWTSEVGPDGRRTASACARAARSSSVSSSTGPATPACSVVMTGGRCSWCSRGGSGRTGWTSSSRPAPARWSTARVEVPHAGWP